MSNETQTTETYPWDKLPGESPQAYKAFKCFLDIGLARTITEAWAEYQISQDKPEKARKSLSGAFKEWVHKFDWWDRAKAWDYYINRLATMKLVEQRTEVYNKYFKELDAVAELCNKAIEKFKEDAEKGRVKGLTPFVAITGLANARKAQTELMQSLAELQAHADAAMVEEIEHELEHEDYDDEDGDEDEDDLS